MAVADLLMSQRRWGQTRCRKFLAQVPMSEKKTDRLDDRASAAHAGGDADLRESGPRVDRDPLANGQPDDSLSCHQPASMPIRPSRGRTSQTPHTPWPRSLTGTPRELVATGFESHPLQLLARAALVLHARSTRRVQFLHTRRQLVAHALERAQVEQRRPAELGTVDGRGRGNERKRSATIAERSRSKRAICARSVARASRSSASRDPRREP